MRAKYIWTLALLVAETVKSGTATNHLESVDGNPPRCRHRMLEVICHYYTKTDSNESSVDTAAASEEVASTPLPQVSPDRVIKHHFIGEPPSPTAKFLKHHYTNPTESVTVTGTMSEKPENVTVVTTSLPDDPACGVERVFEKKVVIALVDVPYTVLSHEEIYKYLEYNFAQAYIEVDCGDRQLFSVTIESEFMAFAAAPVPSGSS